MNSNTIERMRELLTEALHPQQLDIIDESNKHIGHVGAQGGAGHFKLIIRAVIFQDKTRIESHRLIYTALQELIPSKIHALTIKIN